MKKFFLIIFVSLLAFSAKSQEAYLGEIRMVAFNYAPRGWALCNGQILPVMQYQALFSLLGTTYGGDGRTTFALPDLRGRTPLHPSQGVPAVINARLGEKAGVSSVTLLPNNVPLVTTGMASVTKDSLGVKVPIISATTPLPFSTQPPYLGMNFIICVSEGVFPARD